MENIKLPSVIQPRIYEIRGVKVMVDRELSELYGVETRVLKQAVRRNIERFPSDFMFQLTPEELENWKSQTVMSKSVSMGLRHLPFVFTELGVAMLSSVLNSKTAIQTNMNIMRAFVALREAVSVSDDTKKRISEIEQKYTELKEDLEEIFSDYNDINEDTRVQLELINETLANLQENRIAKKSRRLIGYVTPSDEEQY